MRTLLELETEVFSHLTEIDTTVTGAVTDNANIALRRVIRFGINFAQDDIQSKYPRQFFLPQKEWSFNLVSGTHDYRLDSECASLISVTNKTQKHGLPIWTLYNFRDIYKNPWADAQGLPYFVVDNGVTTGSLYSTGTVYFRKGSTSITGIGTTWTSAHSGLVIRRVGDSVNYTFTFVSATSGTLDRKYEGTSSSRRKGASYAIEPVPRLHIYVYPEPNVTDTIEYLGTRRLARLKSDGDISPIGFADDNALFLGGLWHATKHVVPTDEVQIQGKYQDYLTAADAIGKLPSHQPLDMQIIPYIYE